MITYCQIYQTRSSNLITATTLSHHQNLKVAICISPLRHIPFLRILWLIYRWKEETWFWRHCTTKK
jgi:hypothetical protein